MKDYQKPFTRNIQEGNIYRKLSRRNFELQKRMAPAKNYKNNCDTRWGWDGWGTSPKIPKGWRVKDKNWGCRCGWWGHDCQKCGTSCRTSNNHKEPDHSQTSEIIVSVLILILCHILVLGAEVLCTTVLNLFVISVDKGFGRNVHSICIARPPHNKNYRLNDWVFCFLNKPRYQQYYPSWFIICGNLHELLLGSGLGNIVSLLHMVCQSTLLKVGFFFICTVV